MTEQNKAVEASLIPRLGQKVRIADHCPDSELWNQQENFVVGLVSDRCREGVNVWVGPEYPLESESATDGFMVNRWPKPDDLEWRDLSHTATSEVEPVGLRDAAIGLLHFFPLEEGENERGCRFGDAVADLRDALSSTPTPTPDSGLAGELAELQSKASDGPWAYRPEESDDWGFIRGPLRTVDWADYPVRPFVAQARHSDLQDDELHAQCRREKRDPYIDDAKLIVWLRNHVPEILTALQSNSDSELLREVADRAAEFVAACKPMIYPKPDKPETDYGRMVALEEALARLEQGAA